MSCYLILERLSSMYTIQTSLLFSFRCVKLLETVKEMLLSFPINDPTNEEMFAKLEKIRAKFRQVTHVHCKVKSCLFSNKCIHMHVGRMVLSWVTSHGLKSENKN